MGQYTPQPTNSHRESPPCTRICCTKTLEGEGWGVRKQLSSVAPLGVAVCCPCVLLTDALLMTPSHAKASVAVGYVFVAIAFSQSIAPNFAKIYSLRAKAEGGLRFVLSHFSTHVEAIAALGGDDREHAIVQSSLDEAIKRNATVFYTQWWFGMIEDFITKYCVTTVALIVIIGPFFGKKGKAMQSNSGNAEMLSRMRYITSAIIFQLHAVGGLAYLIQKLMKTKGSFRRVLEMLGVLDELNTLCDQDAASVMLPGPSIKFDRVTVETPTGNELVSDLSFVVTPLQNLMITGPNGSGKSSIFRCLGGLWRLKRGTITKPNGGGSAGLCGDVFYLPQKPYNVIGDLRDQLMYPENTAAAREALTDKKLAGLLKMVGLEYLMATDTDAGADKGLSLAATLSLGETQRLAMARLFYHIPTYAILDECTSAVSSDMERMLYKICAEKAITCITISHRPALEEFHHTKLELDGRGTYSLQDIDELERTEDTAGQVGGSDRHGKLIAESNPALGTGGDGVEPALKVLALPDPDGGGSKQTVAPQNGGGGSKKTGKKKTVGWRTRFKYFFDLGKILRPSRGDGSLYRLAALGGIVIYRIYLTDQTAHLNGMALGAMLQQDAGLFARLIKDSLLQCVVQAALAPGLRYMARLLALQWRERLSKHMFDLYFRAKAYYKVNSVYHAIDDSDQRLTEDLDKLTTELANTFPDIIKPSADIIFFTYQAYRILGFKSTALLYSYMLFGFGVLRYTTPNFTELVQKSASNRGAFRFVHSRLRTHGESVAFFGGDQIEGEVCQKYFATMVNHEKRLARASLEHNTINDFVIQRTPPIVTWGLSYLYTVRMQNKAEDLYQDEGAGLSHDLRYVATVVSHTFTAFGELLELYKRMLELYGYTTRVMELETALRAIHMVNGDELEDAWRLATGAAAAAAAESGAGRPSPSIAAAPAGAIVFSGTDVATPTGIRLVSDVKVVVEPGENLLVTGPSGSGKTSLIRVLGGLWPARAGAISRPDPADAAAPFYKTVFLVPQAPYSVLGSLGDQLTYPELSSTAMQVPELVERMDEIMAAVKLQYLVKREGGWNATRRWEDVLSLGEQQRLGMARLFFHRPKFAVLDQCTDAVSSDVEVALYESAAKLGITIITTSQRPALTALHTQELKLSGAGNTQWQVWQLKQQQQQQQQPADGV